MKNYWMIMFTLLLSLRATTQPVFDQRMSITDAGDLYSTIDLNTSSVKADLKRMFGSEYNEMIKRSTESGWPSGLSSLSSRGNHKKEIENFIVYQVMGYDDYIVLKVPSEENQDQPADVKAAYDFFMVFNKSGVGEYSGSVSPIDTQSGIPAKLLSTGGLRSTYDLATDELNPMIRRQLGTEYGQVITSSMEDSWPAGIATMEDRDKVRDVMLKYKCWKIAEFDEKYILRIPASENEFMPVNMRPKQDIYFTIDVEDVKLLK